MQYDRAVAISRRHEQLLTLVKSGSYSSKVLAEKLGVSAPTIYRDITFLKRQGYPIQSVRLSSHWAYHLPQSSRQARRQQ